VIGFLAAFALGFTVLIAVTIVRGTQTPGPSLILAVIVLAIWILWRRRRRLHSADSLGRS
jgi:uncharacterized protein (TIGR03382 family)